MELVSGPKGCVKPMMIVTLGFPLCPSAAPKESQCRTGERSWGEAMMIATMSSFCGHRKHKRNPNVDLANDPMGLVGPMMMATFIFPLWPSAARKES